METVSEADKCSGNCLDQVCVNCPLWFLEGKPREDAAAMVQEQIDLSKKTGDQVRVLEGDIARDLIPEAIDIGLGEHRYIMARAAGRRIRGECVVITVEEGE